MCTAKILSYKFGSFRAEMVKKLVHFHKCKMKKVYVVFYSCHFLFYHGTILQTGIKCKKIPCYMPNSTCWWFIVKKAKKNLKLY